MCPCMLVKRIKTHRSWPYNDSAWKYTELCFPLNPGYALPTSRSNLCLWKRNNILKNIDVSS